MNWKCLLAVIVLAGCASLSGCEQKKKPDAPAEGPAQAPANTTDAQ